MKTPLGRSTRQANTLQGASPDPMNSAVNPLPDSNSPPSKPARRAMLAYVVAAAAAVVTRRSWANAAAAPATGAPPQRSTKVPIEQFAPTGKSLGVAQVDKVVRS